MPTAPVSSSRRRLRSTPAIAIATLHLAGCLLFAAAMAMSGPQSLTITVALTAYMLGVRHAFDADHIVAIDNTTRYLRARDRPAGSVGFWFALGHSSVVLLACLLLGIGWSSLTAHVSGVETAGTTATAIWGPAVSGTFLIVLAGTNGRILLSLWRRRHQSGATSDAVAARGVVTRLLGERGSIRRPGQMLVVGFLFGLGFDTATSVGLLLLTAGADHIVLPWSTFLALPVLFAAGMTLFDSLDGVAMNKAYGWADTERRRLTYNLAVTALSVVAALSVGGLTLIGLMSSIF